MVAQQSDVSEMSNEKAVFLYLSIEKTKADACDTIVDEYTEKVLLFGYLIVTTFFHIRILEVISKPFISVRISPSYQWNNIKIPLERFLFYFKKTIHFL